MARVYQTFDKHGKAHPKWRFMYTDWQGKRKSQTGYPSKKQTERLAAKVEREHEEIRKGYRPPPKSYARHHRTPFEEMKKKYLAWGETRGGKGGLGWSTQHHRTKGRQLDWWAEALDFQTLADLEDILSPVEEALQSLKNDGRANKTVKSYGESIKSFCIWCVKRGFLEVDPLKDLVPFDITPEEPRRPFNLEEIGKLLRVAPDHRCLVYEVALCTGLRVNELRSLSEDDLDIERGGLHLQSEWTKNRRPGFQPLPRRLIELLKKSTSEHFARQLYENKCGNRRFTVPEHPLLYLSADPSTTMERDRKRAGVEKKTDDGKIDFHALRTTFGTLLNMVGATEKEIQHLMRHRPRTITFDRYVKTSEDRLQELISTIADAVRTARDTQNGKISAKQKMAVGATICDTNANGQNCTGWKPKLRTILRTVSQASRFIAPFPSVSARAHSRTSALER
jgi:integrase